MVKNCLKCDKEFYTKPFAIKRGRGKYCSTQCYHQSTIGLLAGSNNPHWSGDNIKYEGLHKWVYKNLGKASRCENIDCVYPRRNAARHILKAPKGFEWANKSGEYKRELSDWMQLCISCHHRYDRRMPNQKRNRFKPQQVKKMD